MREVPFDLDAVKAIWGEIQSNGDDRLQDLKSEVGRKYRSVLMNPISSSTGLLSSPLLPKEIMLYLVDVMDFIHGVNSFYRELKTCRLLTAKDMEVDKHLSRLLDQARQNMASLKKWNESFSAAENSIKINDRPVATQTTEAV